MQLPSIGLLISPLKLQERAVMPRMSSEQLSDYHSAWSNLKRASQEQFNDLVSLRDLSRKFGEKDGEDYLSQRIVEEDRLIATASRMLTAIESQMGMIQRGR